MSLSSPLEVGRGVSESETPGKPSAHSASASRWDRVQRVMKLVRRIVGVPDYDTYVAYMQRHHPECAPMDARTFERERLAAKYTTPGSRCC